MSFFTPDFHADAEAELDSFLNDPARNLRANELMVVIDDVVDNGLLQFEFPHSYAYPYGWSPLYVRETAGFAWDKLVAVFTIIGPGGYGSVLRVLSVHRSCSGAVRTAKPRT